MNFDWGQFLKEQDKFSWSTIATYFPDRTQFCIQARYSSRLHVCPSRGRELLRERPDQIASMIIHGKKAFIADRAWSHEQDILLLELRNTRDLSWSEISDLLPGHSANAVAERYQIPVTTTLMGIGAFDEHHPLALGMLGMHGTAYANFAVTDCDLLIAVGARFDDRVTGKLDEFASRAKVIHIDIDPLNQQLPVSFFPADGRWRADSYSSLRQLVKHIQQDPSIRATLQDSKYKERWDRLDKAHQDRLDRIAMVRYDEERLNDHYKLVMPARDKFGEELRKIVDEAKPKACHW